MPAQRGHDRCRCRWGGLSGKARRASFPGPRGFGMRRPARGDSHVSHRSPTERAVAGARSVDRHRRGAPRRRRSSGTRQRLLRRLRRRRPDRRRRADQGCEHRARRPPSVAVCPAFENGCGPGQVCINDLINAVNNALDGCPLPALIDSDPAAGAANVPRTAWLRIELDGVVASGSLRDFSLTCDGVRRQIGVSAIAGAAGEGGGSPAVVVVNPVGELPPAASCALTWPRAQRLEFATAEAGAPATVVYDRTSTRLTVPYPDDYWLVEDSTTPTGVRIEFPVPDGPTDLQTIFSALAEETNRLDGFSQIAPLVVELSDAPDPASLPLTAAAVARSAGDHRPVRSRRAAARPPHSVPASRAGGHQRQGRRLALAAHFPVDPAVAAPSLRPRGYAPRPRRPGASARSLAVLRGGTRTARDRRSAGERARARARRRRARRRRGGGAADPRRRRRPGGADLGAQRRRHSRRPRRHQGAGARRAAAGARPSPTSRPTRRATWRRSCTARGRLPTGGRART